jgi:hypothetical protein
MVAALAHTVSHIVAQVSQLIALLPAGFLPPFN